MILTPCFEASVSMENVETQAQACLERLVISSMLFMNISDTMETCNKAEVRKAGVSKHSDLWKAFF